MKKILCIVVVFALCIPFACADSLGDYFGGFSSLLNLDDPSTMYAPGETAELDSNDIKLTDVMISDGGSMYKPAEGNVFIIFEFEISNKTNEAESISSMLCFSPTVDGKTYSISIEAVTVAMFSGKAQFDMEIEPSETKIGIVGYEIPQEWKEIKITVKPDFYGIDKATFLVNK